MTKNENESTRCEKCGKYFYKYQPMHFTWFTSAPYIKCPYCGKKKYLDFSKLYNTEV